RAGQGHAGAWAGDDALFLVDPLAEAIGLGVGDLDDSVVLLGQKEIGQPQGLEAANAGDVVALGRVDAEDLDAFVRRFEKAAGAGDGAAGAQSGDEVSDPAGGLLPDFGAGGAKVGVGVGGVLVLVELVPAGLLGEFGGLLHGAFGCAGHGAEVIGEF